MRPGGAPDQADVAARPGRRSDLDWLRVVAFGLLILFHVGLVYAPFDWHIHSRHTEGWLRQAILVTGPWRLTLLFLISGAALRLMSQGRPAAGVLGARIARLVPPAVFGVLVLVPPQAFIEAVDKGLWGGNLLDWWRWQFSAAGVAAGVPVNHIWFVIYILAYSVAATLLMLAPRWTDKLSGGVEATLRRGGVLILPIAYLLLARQALFLRYGISNHISDDWYNHTVSFGAFLLGFMVVGRSGVWRMLERLRWLSLALAAIALPVLAWLESTPSITPEGWTTSTAYAVDQWATIAAILGFGYRQLRDRDGPVLRYLTQAVFPCYLAHQTILVALVWGLRPMNLPALPEALLLIALTVGGCLAVYEVVRRVNLIRPLFGMKPLPRAVITRTEVAEPQPTPGQLNDAPALTAEAA